MTVSAVGSGLAAFTLWGQVPRVTSTSFAIISGSLDGPIANLTPVVMDEQHLS